MTTYQWFVFFLFIQVIHFLGTWKLYEAAGRKKWEAAIPVYNAITLMKIIGRPTWWTVLLFIPVINLLMFPVIWVETLRSFGKRSTIATFLGIITFGFYIYYLSYTQKLTYRSDRSLLPDTKAGDTISSLLFAIIVATLVHTYAIQPFTIPTSSLEKSLLVGDFLFVSKMHYGPRTPMTPIALPMVHDTIPVMKTKSYLKWPQLPYFRFPAAQKIKNCDIVVFNWPLDTVYFFRDPSGRHVDKPIDKKSNYVKRCVAIPGDSLAIQDGIVFINGKELVLPERAKPQYSYSITLDGRTPIDFEYLFKDMNVTDGINYVSEQKDTIGIAALTFENAERLKNVPGITSVTRSIEKRVEPGIFPHINKWNRDNYGPIYIPQAGKTVAINLMTLPFYSRIITDYEKNTIEIKGSDIYINNQKTKKYTFKQDYYWMMGDNRHNSEDSRYWGYVPADHIVGKPVFIWMSWDSNGKGWNKIRWERLFTTVGGDGQPQSYFRWFLLVLVGYFVAEYFWKKRKEAKG
jgi:signal peptidase I